MASGRQDRISGDNVLVVYIPKDICMNQITTNQLTLNKEVVPG